MLKRRNIIIPAGAASLTIVVAEGLTGDRGYY